MTANCSVVWVHHLFDNVSLIKEPSRHIRVKQTNKTTPSKTRLQYMRSQTTRPAVAWQCTGMTSLLLHHWCSQTTCWFPHFPCQYLCYLKRKTKSKKKPEEYQEQTDIMGEWQQQQQQRTCSGRNARVGRATAAALQLNSQTKKNRKKH